MNVCIIPARGGSRRIPRKNIKDFLGKPIIAYSIESATKSNCFDQIIVSTDDTEIAEIASQFGAEVPFIRPNELSDDFSTTFAVIKHALESNDNLNKVENVCCLYATAPFVSKDSLINSYQKFRDSNALFCLAVTPYSSPIQRALRISKDSSLEMLNPEYTETRSQDLDDTFHDAGQFCWGTAEAFINELPLYSRRTIPFHIPRLHSQDIDSEEDWILAEAIYQATR